MMADTPDTPSDTPKPAAKPRARRAARTTGAKPTRRTPAKAATPVAEATPTRVKAPPKPRSSKRAAPRPAKAKTVVTPRPAKPEPVADAPKGGIGRWGAAAIAGGLTVAGAIAALLTLRGSSAKPAGNAKGPHAHQADGTDSSASFAAGIADEGTVPDTE